MSSLGVFFLGIIASCSVILVIAILIFVFSALKILRSMNEKSSIVTKELEYLLPKLRTVASNVEEFSRLFAVFSLFKKK